MIAATLATADLLAAGLRRHIPSPLDDAQAWLQHWRMRRDVHRFQAVRADLYRDLRDDLQDGSDLQDALHRIKHIYSKKGTDHRHPALPALHAWTDKSRRADRLSTLLRNWAPTYDVQMILAADASGQVPRMLGRLVDQIDIQSKLTMLFFSPVAQMLRSVFTVVLLLGVSLYFTIPSLRAMIDIRKLPPFPGRAMIHLSDALHDPMALLVAVPLLVATLWVVWSFQNWTGPLRVWAERHFALYGLYRDIAGARFLKALAPFKSAGKSDAEAMHILAQEGTPYERSRIAPAAQYCAANHGIGESFEYAGHDFPDAALIMRLIATQGRQNQVTSIEDMAARHLANIERRVEKFGRSVALFGWLVVAIGFAVQTFADLQIIGSLVSTGR